MSAPCDVTSDRSCDRARGLSLKQFSSVLEDIAGDARSIFPWFMVTTGVLEDRFSVAFRGKKLVASGFNSLFSQVAYENSIFVISEGIDSFWITTAGLGSSSFENS